MSNLPSLLKSETNKDERLLVELICAPRAKLKFPAPVDVFLYTSKPFVVALPFTLARSILPSPSKSPVPVGLNLESCHAVPILTVGVNVEIVNSDGNAQLFMS